MSKIANHVTLNLLDNVTVLDGQFVNSTVSVANTSTVFANLSANIASYSPPFAPVRIGSNLELAVVNYTSATLSDPAQLEFGADVGNVNGAFVHVLSNSSTSAFTVSMFMRTLANDDLFTRLAPSSQLIPPTFLPRSSRITGSAIVDFNVFTSGNRRTTAFKYNAGDGVFTFSTLGDSQSRVRVLDNNYAYPNI
jgi:hypothetical protein